MILTVEWAGHILFTNAIDGGIEMVLLALLHTTSVNLTYKQSSHVDIRLNASHTYRELFEVFLLQ